MGKRPQAKSDFSDEDADVRALLERYRCPLPFHAVRTRLLGHIASPVSAISPIDAVKGLWGGKLPEFETPAAAEEFMGTLVMGLWNKLTRHQERRVPFRLMRSTIAETREGLARITRVRREELDGFIAGLFGGKTSLYLPAPAQSALRVLSDIRGMLAGVHQLASNPEKSMPGDDVGGLLQQNGELSKIAETEMHAAVLACAQERGGRTRR